jgi:hypothetical protein
MGGCHVNSIIFEKSYQYSQWEVVTWQPLIGSPMPCVNIYFTHLDCSDLSNHLPTNVPRHMYDHVPCVTLVVVTHVTLLPMLTLTFDLVWLLINFAYDHCLTCHLHHWKADDEIYALMSFLREFGIVKFWAFSRSPRTFVSVSDPPGPLWEFLISSWIRRSQG